MPKGTKEPTTAKSLYLKFTEPEDLALYDRLVADAKVKRYEPNVYALLVLLEAYPAPATTAE